MGGAIGALVVLVLGVVYVAMRIIMSNRKKQRALQELKDEVAAALRNRMLRLQAKYSGDSNLQRLIDQTLWRGESAEQVRDSFGEPEDVDEQVLKTKKKEVWKYDHKGGNKYGLRITLENDVVVGWDAK